MRVKRLILVLAAFAFFTPLGAQLSYAQSDATQPLTALPPGDFPVTEESLTAARRLLEASGATEMMNVMLERTLPPLLRQMIAERQAPPEDMELISAIIIEELRAGIPTFLDMAARGYAMRLSVDDMNATSAFFATAAGRRYVEASPQLSADLANVGAAWGAEIVGPRVAERLQVYFEEREARDTP